MRHPIIQKRLDFFKANGDEYSNENNLLQTIRIPKNLLFLTDRLPQPNYEKIPTKKNLSFQNNSLPEVKIPPNSKNRRKEREANKDSYVRNKEGSIDMPLQKERDHSPKARNVVSLQPTRPEDSEIIKNRLKLKDGDDSKLTNIKVVKPADIAHEDKRSVLPSIKSHSNYENVSERSPKRK